MATPIHKTISQQYVFYDRLKDEKESSHRELHTNALSAVEDYATYYKKDGKLASIAARLLAMANAEKAKEEALLREVLKLDSFTINYSDDRQDEINQIIGHFNEILGYKKIIERYKLVLESGNVTGVNPYIFISDYFNKAIKNSSQRISRAINKALNQNLDADLAPILANALAPCADIAIKKFLKMNALENDDFGTFSELLKELEGNTAAGTILREGFFGIYTKSLIDSITKMVAENAKLGVVKKIKGSDLKINEGSIYSKGGLWAEWVSNAIVTAGQKGFSSFHAGPYNARPDNILTYGINIENITKFLENEKHNLTRKEARDIFTKISREIENLNEGFIIYESDKTSTFGKSVKGISGGTEIKLADYGYLVGNLNKSGAIAQTLEGAVGKQYREDITQSVAEDIAYLLFDDFETIGSGTRSIHVFNINGVYVPLSVFLFRLGKAVEKTDKIPKEMLKLHLHYKKSDEILYPKDSEDIPKNAWQNQRTSALENISISLTFFKDFNDLIRNYR